MRVVPAVPVSVPAVRLRACVATRCERGPVVRVAPGSRAGIPSHDPFGLAPSLNAGDGLLSRPAEGCLGAAVGPGRARFLGPVASSSGAAQPD